MNNQLYQIIKTICSRWHNLSVSASYITDYGTLAVPNIGNIKYRTLTNSFFSKDQ